MDARDVLILLVAVVSIGAYIISAVALPLVASVMIGAVVVAIFFLAGGPSTLGNSLIGTGLVMFWSIANTVAVSSSGYSAILAFVSIWFFRRAWGTYREFRFRQRQEGWDGLTWVEHLSQQKENTWRKRYSAGKR